MCFLAIPAAVVFPNKNGTISGEKFSSLKKLNTLRLSKLTCEPFFVLAVLFILPILFACYGSKMRLPYFGNLSTSIFWKLGFSGFAFWGSTVFFSYSLKKTRLNVLVAFKIALCWVFVFCLYILTFL